MCTLLAMRYCAFFVFIEILNKLPVRLLSFVLE